MGEQTWYQNLLRVQTGTIKKADLLLKIGIVIALISGLIFGVLAVSVINHLSITAEDGKLVTLMHQQALNGPAWMITLMLAISGLGRWAIIAAAFLIGLYWLWQKDWRPLTMLIIGVAGGAGIFLLTAGQIARPRPSFQNPISTIPYPSFPSGHLISSVTFYGLLVYLYMPRIKSPFWRAVIIVSYFVLIGLISYSRLYVGDHYLSDLPAGFLVGLAWSALVYPGVDWFWAHRVKKA